MFKIKMSSRVEEGWILLELHSCASINDPNQLIVGVPTQR